MNAAQKLKHMILVNGGVDVNELDNIDDLYYEHKYDDWVSDYRNELRPGTEKTNLACEYSRHYESVSVAAQMLDGSWVGWTYMYGGGKHGEPQAYDWILDAYDLTCTEEQKLVTVRTWNKV